MINVFLSGFISIQTGFEYICSLYLTVNWRKRNPKKIRALVRSRGKSLSEEGMRFPEAYPVPSPPPILPFCAFMDEADSSFLGFL